MNVPEASSTPGPGPSSGPGSTPGAPPVTSDANRQLLLRVIYMVLFGVAFWVVCWVLAVTAVVQLVLRLVGGAPNADLQRFGRALGSYAGQVIAFLTFASDVLPFPFTAWPEGPGELR